MAAAAATAAGRERAEGGGDATSPPLPLPPRGQRADDTLDEVTRRELCTDTFCNVCGAVLQFESQRISHYEGKRHAQKVRLYLQMRSEQEEGQEPNKQKKQYVNFQMDPNVDKNTYCRLCNMIFTSAIVAQSHYLGKIHTKKLKQLSGDQAQQATQSTQPEPGLSVTPALPESTAEKTSQETDAEDPSSSSGITLDLDDPEKYCKLCSAPFNNPLMAHQHYVGKKHKRNEARKKLMAEIGSEAIPMESKANVGVGNYVCPICSISLTSIEMYQSHMQGNKHQIKETMVVNLMKNSKKTYNSFQDELADYIKVQKARGLEPKTNFRKPEEEFQNEEFEAINGHEEDFAFNQDQFSYDTYEPDQHSFFFSEMCAPSHSVENRLSHWSPAHEDLLKLENAPMSQCNTECYSKKQMSHLTTYKFDNCDPSSAESSDGCKPVSAENSSSSHRRSRKLPKLHKKEKGCTRESDENPHQQLPTPKRKQHSEEETDSGKDSENQKRKKDNAISVTEWKSKHSKDKGNKESSSEKESRRHKKEKKKAEAHGPTEEEMLWDESILGF
ncbi:zinc finger matrin-type protein 1-like isoform X2 [Hemicordylus capensis]|uniref:zinc finger matrin-type protein 1-like isoform X2 n=1 Tax=Hemicordylus capensis TaxID=884348 RepID=UPI00230492FC|nr:zinc finger matrin-type protein 1-like isoform X2 [Hemicordylus capensis]